MDDGVDYEAWNRDTAAARSKAEISAYLYMFGAWLTSREERSGPFSGHDDAAQMAALLGEFIKKYELGDPNFNLIPMLPDNV